LFAIYVIIAGMNDKQLTKLLNKLAESYFLFAPQKLGDNFQVGYEYRIREVRNLEEIDWSGAMPYGSWKEILLPHHERLFDILKGRLVETKTKYPPIACIAMNILDLKALTLFEQVFGSDVYYQKRRQPMLLVGYSTGLPSDYKKYKVFSHNYEEDVLEHVIFDIFIIQQKNGRIKFYAGSEKGQSTLDQAGLTNYHNIEFAGPLSESGSDKTMLSIMAKMEKSANKKIWNELDRRCLACGKCVMACPTCFCFDLSDRADDEQQSRSRQWGVCFYNDFSLVAGGHKELDTVKKKIFFWYYHKLVRIPKQYSLPGCVGCGRCIKACPVNININETINALD